MITYLNAEEVGFEPTKGFTPCRVSNAVPSTTQPLLHVYFYPLLKTLPLLHCIYILYYETLPLLQIIKNLSTLLPFFKKMIYFQNHGPIV
jgi:hypothetical protein